MEVSVVLPVRNGAEVIAGQLAALADQDVAGSFEVVVADNGSTDGTRAVVEAWADRLPALRVVSAGDRPNIAATRNAGARAATADRLLFCDADDEVAPSWVRAMVTALEEADLVGGPVEQFDDRGRDRGSLQVDGLPTSLGYLPFTIGANLGVRRRAFEAVGGFDEGWPVVGAEDIDLCWRAQLAGASVDFAPEARVRYRQPATLRTTARKRWGYGTGSAALVARYARHGARRWTAADHLRDLASLARDVWWLASDGRRVAWVERAAWVGGRLRGPVNRPTELAPGPGSES